MAKLTGFGSKSFGFSILTLQQISYFTKSKVPSSLGSSAQLRQQPDLSAALVLPSSE